MNILDGVHLIKVPVPYPLRHVNTYLLEGERGWTLIDCGCNTDETHDFWKKTLPEYGVAPGQLSIFVSHFHPDHLGAAGWLQQEWSAPVKMHAPDLEWARTAWLPASDQAELIAALYRKHGCPPTVADAVRDQYIGQAKDTTPLPERVKTFSAGDTFTLGPLTFETVWAPGHADGMVMLWQSELRLLIAADAILPHITPNVGLWPRCRENPLADFIDTLKRIRALSPERTFPGHGKIMEDTTSRVDEVLAHHEDRLSQMTAYLQGGPRSAFDVAVEYFKLSDLSAHQVRFALAETLAHMHYLVVEGRLEEREDAQGNIGFVPRLRA